MGIKSLTIKLLVQQFLRITGPLWVESALGHWIPHHKGSVKGKAFPCHGNMMLATKNVNTLRPRQDGHLFAYDIFLNEKVWISIMISLKFVPVQLTIHEHWFR